MSGPPLVRPFGDRALLVELGDVHATHRLARALTGRAGPASRPGVEEVVVGLGAVTVVFDPDRLARAALAEELAAAAAQALEATDAHEAAAAGRGTGGGGEPAVHDVPVRFDGPDLEEVAALAGSTAAQVVELLAGATLEVAFVGFSPGFGYLLGLPAALGAVPRRARPRPEVPAGSVALGGGFAGVYPQATPGGWQLVGRTGAVLFDASRPPFATLAPGDRVRLRPVPDEQVPAQPPGRPRHAAASRRALVVEEPGACSLIQDGGRVGLAALGVPRAGAADAVGARLVNRLLGNDDGAAVLEMTVTGPRLRATAALEVALVGDPSRPGLLTALVDGTAVPEATVVPLAAGQVLQVTRCAGAVRAVLGVAGGLDTPLVLGSRSSDLLCGLGPGPLVSGDALGVGVPGRPRGRLRSLPAPPGGAMTLRVLPGPDLPGDATPPGPGLWPLAGRWQVAPESNRVGTRLRRADADGPVAMGGIGAATSRGMVQGAVQLPPGGEPIVLGPDHATAGGYPVVAVVVAADLHRLAHLRPGEDVSFTLVDVAAADRSRHELAAAVDAAVSGWFPTRAG